MYALKKITSGREQSCKYYLGDIVNLDNIKLFTDEAFVTMEREACGYGDTFIEVGKEISNSCELWDDLFWGYNYGFRKNIKTNHSETRTIYLCKMIDIENYIDHIPEKYEGIEKDNDLFEKIAYDDLDLFYYEDGIGYDILEEYLPISFKYLIDALEYTLMPFEYLNITDVPADKIGYLIEMSIKEAINDIIDRFDDTLSKKYEIKIIENTTENDDYSCEAKVCFKETNENITIMYEKDDHYVYIEGIE